MMTQSPAVYWLISFVWLSFRNAKTKTERYDRYRLQEICFSSLCTPAKWSHRTTDNYRCRTSGQTTRRTSAKRVNIKTIILQIILNIANMLVNLTDIAPRTEPVLRVFDNYMTFNAHAAQMLGLSDGDKVYIGREERMANNLYVGKAKLKQSNVVRRRGKTFLLHNAALTRAVAGWLEGKGTYRICSEDKMEDCFGNLYYNIFKKKYGN